MSTSEMGAAVSEGTSASEKDAIYAKKILSISQKNLSISIEHHDAKREAH